MNYDQKGQGLGRGGQPCLRYGSQNSAELMVCNVRYLAAASRWQKVGPPLYTIISKTSLCHMPSTEAIPLAKGREMELSFDRPRPTHN